MPARVWICVGALVTAAAVALGAIGAHGLEPRLADAGYSGQELAKRLDWFHTAVRYLMLHGPGVMLIGIILERRRHPMLHVSGWLMLLGVLLFCGGLLAIAIGPETWRSLVHAVPFGGGSMILGWLALAGGSLLAIERTQT